MRLDPRLRQLEEEKEILETAGDDNEARAAKATYKLYKEKEAKDLGKREYFMERLDNRKKYNDYNRLCCEITLFYIEDLGLPPNIKYRLQYDTQGVLLFVNVGKRIYQRAFKAVREPKYDLNACMVFASSITNLLNGPAQPKQS